MTPTILVLLGGLGLILVGIGLLGTLLGVQATLASFGDLEIGLIMAGYYAGYIAGTVLAPRLIRNVGHIRCFAAFAALASAATLGFGLLVNPYAWLGLRVLNGVCVVGLYMVVESWINEQTTGPGRGRVFALYMMSTLVALALGQTLLLAGDSSSLTLFAFAAVLISLGVIPVAVTRVTEPRIDVSMRVRLPQLLRASPLGVMGALSAGTVNGAFWGMAPVFGQRLPLEEPQIVQLMSATIIGGALLQWPIGHLSDRLDRRIVLILTSLATATVALFAGYVVIEGAVGTDPLRLSLWRAHVLALRYQRRPHQRSVGAGPGTGGDARPAPDLRGRGPVRPCGRWPCDGSRGPRGATRHVRGDRRAAGALRPLPDGATLRTARGRPDRVRGPGADLAGRPGNASGCRPKRGDRLQPPGRGPLREDSEPSPRLRTPDRRVLPGGGKILRVA
ncbi:MAG: MFS transporter [Chromatiaceae bacterium]